MKYTRLGAKRVVNGRFEVNTLSVYMGLPCARCSWNSTRYRSKRTIYFWAYSKLPCPWFRNSANCINCNRRIFGFIVWFPFTTVYLFFFFMLVRIARLPKNSLRHAPQRSSNARIVFRLLSPCKNIAIKRIALGFIDGWIVVYRRTEKTNNGLRLERFQTKKKFSLTSHSQTPSWRRRHAPLNHCWHENKKRIHLFAPYFERGSNLVFRAPSGSKELVPSRNPIVFARLAVGHGRRSHPVRKFKNKYGETGSRLDGK